MFVLWADSISENNENETRIKKEKRKKKVNRIKFICRFSALVRGMLYLLYIFLI